MSYLPQGSVLDDLWSATKKIGGGALDVVKSQAAAQATIEAQKAQLERGQPAPSSMPPWLLPVGIGAVALVLLVVLKKK